MHHHINTFMDSKNKKSHHFDAATVSGTKRCPGWLLSINKNWRCERCYKTAHGGPGSKESIN
jgi:hypothetical protein